MDAASRAPCGPLTIPDAPLTEREEQEQCSPSCAGSASTDTDGSATTPTFATSDGGAGAESSSGTRGSPGGPLASDPLTVALLRAIVHQNARIVAWLTDHRLPLVVALATAIAAAALWWAWPMPQSERLAGPDQQTERPFAGPDGRVP